MADAPAHTRRGNLAFRIRVVAEDEQGQRCAEFEGNYRLLAASIERYNGIAMKVMRELEVPINDLHAALADGKQPVKSLIGNDGVHLVPAGQQVAAARVAAFIKQHLPDANEAQEGAR